MLSVNVSGPGELEAFAQAKLGKRIRIVGKRTVAADEAGRVRVVVRLSRAARERLADGKRVRVIVAVSFADAGQIPRLFPEVRAISLSQPGYRRRPFRSRPLTAALNGAIFGSLSSA